LSAKKIEIIVLFHAVYHFNNLFASVLTECSIITGNISLKKWIEPISTSVHPR